MRPKNVGDSVQRKYLQLPLTIGRAINSEGLRALNFCDIYLCCWAVSTMCAELFGYSQTTEQDTRNHEGMSDSGKEQKLQQTSEIS